VTLHATGGADGDGPATTFRRWSDDRCPAADSCTLTVGADDVTVTALFSPQRVTVRAAGLAGSVAVAPTGFLGGLQPSCVLDGVTTPLDCHEDFDPDLAGPVTLTASPAPPASRWLGTSASRGFLCDSVAGPVCSVRPAWPRWASVGFGVDPEEPDGPPEVDVNFRVAKTGSGSGTVRSGSVDCGGHCTTSATFGTTETFTATPDNGSRFAGWRAACGNAATCRLAVGPVTSLTAVFDKAARAVGGTGGKNPGTKKPQGRRAFAARVLRVGVSGHGRRRTLSIRLRVNSAATVRARLLRGRNQVAAHRWRVRRPGVQVLRMRVPARARPGSYRVRLTITGQGRTVRVTRGVRVRR
jgi:hypothetical protein